MSSAGMDDQKVSVSVSMDYYYMHTVSNLGLALLLS
jgi:hypothetical protein